MTSITISHSITHSHQISERPATLEKLVLLRKAKQQGDRTCIVYAPAQDLDFVYGHISTAVWCDLIVIDMPPSPRADIDWGEYGCRCEALCKKYGRAYQISGALCGEMKKIKGG